MSASQLGATVRKTKRKTYGIVDSRQGDFISTKNIDRSHKVTLNRLIEHYRNNGYPYEVSEIRDLVRKRHSVK